MTTKWLRIVLRDPVVQFPREWVLVIEVEVEVGLLAAWLMVSRPILRYESGGKCGVWEYKECTWTE